MLKPSSTTGEHCNSCVFNEIESDQPRSALKRATEQQMVVTYATAMKDGREARYVIGDKATDELYNRHFAAKKCAELVVAGECEMFCALSRLDGGVEIVPRDTT